MLKRKREGYALIYVMCVLLLITAFSASILTLVESNRLTTSYVDKSNKARLAAETGIESGISAFKKYVASNPQEFINVEDSTNSSVHFTVNSLNNPTHNAANLPNDSSYSYVISDGNQYISTSTKAGTNIIDPNNGGNPTCVIITATGTCGSVSKTMTVYVDEKDISNFYYDRMFGQTIYLENNNNNIPEINTVNKATTSDANPYAESFYTPVYDTSVTNRALSMITYKSDGISPTFTLKNITDHMYQYATGPTLATDFNNIDVSREDGILKALGNQNTKKYIESITAANGTNSVDQMLKYCSVYKVIFINGDLDVGTMSVPLVNYVIYCSGTIKVTNQSNLKLWNCNIYANKISYDDGSGRPIYLNVNINNKKATFLDSNNNALGYEPFEIKGILSTDAKETILKHLLAYDSTSDNPYVDTQNYMTTQLHNLDITSIFPTGVAEQFKSQDRAAADQSFYNNLNGYGYGLKLRYLDIEEK